MLEYAYDLGSFRFLDGLYDCESIREFLERLAIILSKKLLNRIKQGIYKSYRKETEELAFVRGSIDMNALWRRPVKIKSKKKLLKDRMFRNRVNELSRKLIKSQPEI